MPHHRAVTNSRDIGHGTAFTIQSGALRGQDVIDLKLAGDGIIEVIVEYFNASGLAIRLNDAICKCRPWRMGDADVNRLSGTISSWTIEQILEIPADEAVSV